MRYIIAVLVCASGVALAAGTAGTYDFGKHEYDAKCAGCHGVTGKGDGINKPYLNKSPTDLSTLSKQNGGVFPYAEVYNFVDGRFGGAARGACDMPVYANEYSANAAGDYMDVSYDPERYVETRVDALVDYVERLQVK